MLLRPKSLHRQINLRTAALFSIRIYGAPKLSVGGAKAIRRSAVVTSTRHDIGATLSPDETKIAFDSDRTGTFEIWTSNKDGSDLVRLTTLQIDQTGSPRWSPDGKNIAFDSRVKGRGGIFVVALDRSSPRPIAIDDFDNSVPSWSADGKWVYYTSKHGDSIQIWKTPSSGGQPVQVTTAIGNRPFETADGRALYFLGSPRGDEIWEKRLPDGAERRVPEITEPVDTWQVAQNGIYFVRRKKSIPELWFFQFETRSTKKIMDIPDRGFMGEISINKDGKEMLYTQIDSSGMDIMLVRNFH